MAKHSWIRKWSTRPAARTIRTAPRSFRPTLEALEDRTLLTTFTPSIFTDGGAGSGSLRAAVIAANADAGAATDVISLSAGTYALTIQGGGENAAAAGDLDVTSKAHKLIIQGNGSTGANATIIDASALMDRVFQIVNAGTIIEFDNLVIKGGTAHDNGTAGAVAGSTNAEGGGVLNNGGNLTFNNVVLQSNTAQGGVARDADGGAIASNGGSVTLNNSTLSSNTVIGGQADSTTSAHGGFGQGGGMYANGAVTTITASTFDGNSATGGSSLGGSPPAGAGAGGGLYSSGGGTTIQTSIFSNNQAIGGPGQRVSQSFTGAGDSFGGGLYAGGSTTLVQASTFFNNTARGQGEVANLGGGLFARGGSATVVACTLSNNFAFFFDPTGGPKMQVIDGPPLSFGDGLYAESGAAVTLSNTIIAGVAPLYILGTGIPLHPTAGSGGIYTQPDVTLAGGHNLIQDGSGLFADTIKADPLFAAFGNYGGPTKTLALLPESPAMGAGSAVTGLTTDQRGVARTGSLDIGAFQSRGFTVTATEGDGQSAYVRTAFAKGLIVTVSSAFNEPTAGGKVTFAVAPAAPGAPSAAFSAGDVTIAADGTATPQMAVDVFGHTVPLLPIANAVAGSYTSITATTSRANAVGFMLTNLALPNILTATTLSDGLAPGTLRGAVSAFNADPGAVTDTINLQSGTYALTSGGDLDITSTAHKLIIQGQGTTGPNATIIDASALNDRVFNIVNAGTIVEFDNLVIKGGTAHDNGTESTPTANVAPTNAEGGGVLDNGGNLTFNNVVFDSNTAQAGNTSLTLSANGRPGLDALGGAIYAGVGSVLSISNTTFSSNRVVGGRGGESFTMVNAPLGTVHGGVGGAGRGGALYATGASVTINGSTFSSNQAVGGVGGDAFSASLPPFDLFSGAPGGVGEGGGLVALNSGVLTIANSTFFANSAQGGSGTAGGDTGDFPGGTPGGAGGDGLAGAASLGNEPITISNSTFSANTALGGNGGAGGVDIKRPAETLTRGAAGPAGNGRTGGILFAGAATLNNTIVAGDTGGDVTVSSGTLVGGHNLIQDGSGGLSDTIKADPLLGALADNGGPTKTLALLTGSPAYRSGDVALIPAGVTTDQRGLPRSANGAVDIGAFEDQTVAISTTTGVTSSAATSNYGDSVTFTATVAAASTPTGAVNFVIDGGSAAAGVAGATTGTTATWTFTTNALTAGPHTVQAFFVSSGGFVSGNGTLSGGQTVNKANATVVVTPYNTTYDGSAHTAMVASITGVNGETGATVGAVTLNTTHTNAAAYGDFYTFKGGPNYNDIGATLVADAITQADATVVVTPYTVTYDGKMHTATVTSIVGVNGEMGATVGVVDVTHTTHTDAGTYTVDSWSFTGAANYKTIASTTITDVINKANATVVVAPYFVTYNGSPHTATVTSITGVNGETGATVGVVDLSNTTHTNAGTYAGDTWSFAGAANYNDIASTTISDAINKAAATVVVTPYTVTYDGKTHTATATITGVNGESGATVGVVDLSNTTHTNAGAYAGDSLSFTGAANYNDGASTTITDTINKADAIIVIAPYTLTYDGKTHTATVTSITGVNGETGATVGSVTLDATHTNAGVYAGDFWSFTGGANYNDVASTPITDTINKADATIVVTPYTVTYDGSPHTAAVTPIIGVNGEMGAIVGTVTLNTTHTNAGVYSDSWRFTGGANYNDVASTTITDVINKAPSTVVVTINGGPFTYTGLAQTPAAVSVTGAAGLNLTPTAIYANNVNAGLATASYTYAGDANHTGSSDSKNFTIGKANATVVVTPYALAYDGKPHTAAVTSITGVHGETGATVGVVTLNTTHTNAGTYASDSWNFTGAANYKDVASTTITDTIHKANATVVVTPYTVAYDGTPHTATVTTLTGVNGETGAKVGVVNVNNTTHTNAGAYVGDSWSFTGANYNSIANTTITDAVNKANATVVVTPYTVKFDGNPHTATVASITGVNGETGATVGAVDLSNTTHTNVGTFASDSWSFAGANYNSIVGATITDTVQASLPPSVSVAFGPSGEVVEVVDSTGVLTQYDAAGAHVLGGGVRTASIAFGPNGYLLEVVSSVGILTQFDSSGAHQLGGAGVESASVAFGPGGVVLDVVLEDGSARQFSAAGVQLLAASGVESASVAFGPSGEVVDMVSTEGVLTQYSAAGVQQIGGAGVRSAGVAFMGNSEVLDIIFADGTLDQFDAFGVHRLGMVL